MSAKLAQFLHQDRLQAANIVVNIPLVRQTVDDLIGLLFPQRGHFGPKTLEETQEKLEILEQRFLDFLQGLAPLDGTLKTTGRDKIKAFFAGLSAVTHKLDADVAAAFAGDPAAYSPEEVIITYPGFYAVCVYRLAHEIYQLNIPLLPRLMSEYAHEKTGIDIHPGAQIEESFFIDHGTGVVIGETSIIGKNVKIYQGVTLGALSVKKKHQSKKRHPTIQSGVVIYANSTILGGETTIGKGSVIGGNVWLTESVPENSLVFNKLESDHRFGSSEGAGPI
jgi:serine O-acetyltransferase